jgi:UDP-glucuronate decarboxylase
MLTMKKILVTGGTGFIGSNLCARLIADGNTVICLDNNSTGSINNIKNLMNSPKFKFIMHDVVNPLLISQVDQIYHLACPASPPAYQLDPIKTIQTNVIGTMNVLEFATMSMARILLSSTSEVYGDPKVSPQSEEYWGNVNPIGPRSCYDEGKRVAETLMMEYHNVKKTDIRIARIFNTYGPNMDREDGRVVSNFINQCLENKDITVYGDGSQTRSLCYIDDTVEGLIRLMNQDYTIGPINLGNPYELSVEEIGLFIKELTQSESKLVFKNLPKDDPMIRCPDITKAINVLGWEPQVQLKDGILKTVDYFKKLRKETFQEYNLKK